MHYQALHAARAGLSSSKAAALPIFVPLAAYDDYLSHSPQKPALEHFLAVYYDQWHSLPGLAPLFEQALEDGHALILLDGLDEVLDAGTRQFVAEQAGALIRQWASRGNRFAVTSRIVGYREARLPGDLPHVTVLDFGRPEIEIFAHQWCKSYEIWAAGTETPTALRRAAEEEKALLDDVQSNPSVERLAASPLLITMLALLRRHVGKLPDRRVELYERYIRTLIDHWENARSAGARQLAPERFDPHRAIAHLIELAFWLQQHKPTGTARRQELEQELEKICLRYEGHDPEKAPPKACIQAQQDAARFLRDMRHFAGLLAERGRDAFGFLHLTFQEYFSGRALARMEPDACWQAIQPNLHRPRWREPILLCAGQLGVIEQRRDRTSDLAKRILQADSEHEAILHRDLFLTTAIASDNVGLSNTLLDELTRLLSDLKDSGTPTVRETALAGLAQIARIDHPAALEVLEEALQHSELQYDTMHAVRAVIGTEACVSLQQAITAKLDDAVYPVRQAAIQALATLVSSDQKLRSTLLFWLGTVTEYQKNTERSTRQLLAETYAPLLVSDSDLLHAVSAMLTSPSWPVRQGAAWTLIAMPGGPPASVLPTLYGLLDDMRGEESWPRRLQVSALLINDRDRMLSQRALAVALEALDYATQPWYDLPRQGSQVRRQAAQILGTLEPLYRDEAVFARLVRVLEEDDNAQVRDTAYGALFRLAAAPEEVLADKI